MPRRPSLVVSLLALVPVGLLAVARTRPGTAKRDTALPDGQGLVGSWRITIFEADGPPTLALATFGADHTVVTAEHPVVTPPIAPGVIFTSSGHGAWQATGPDTAIITFVGLGGDGQGNLFGTATAHASLRLGADGQTFSGEFVFTIADRVGHELATYPGTLQATRIVAQAPASPAPAGRDAATPAE